MITPFYHDDWLTLYGGDCREVLASLPADSVDCVVTSPPYWGLRDYGTASWVGGDETHGHIGSQTRSGPTGSAKQASKRGSTDVYSGDCSCGAQRVDSQLGLERTPEEYVANMVAVFREVRRVLKPSGTCWLNLGDSYAAQRSGTTMPAETLAGGENGWTPDGKRTNRDRHDGYSPSRNAGAIGLKHKDLVGIPWRVAFALQADGWYLRSDVIWSKPNPMPESVTDRPTKSHEYLFLLTKSAGYYFDADAVRETALQPQGEPKLTGQHKRGILQDLTASTLGTNQGAAGRNIRSVWTIATRPYPGAHFAVFPPELPERCMKAGSPEGGLVLDPFAGSGTVGLVANRLSRRALLIDLNPDYLKQQMARNAQTPLGLLLPSP